MNALGLAAPNQIRCQRAAVARPYRGSLRLRGLVVDKFPCPNCGRSFGSQRAVGMHRAKVNACEPSLAEALWSKVETSDDPNACWPWTGSTRRKGYGRMWWRGRTYLVTHVALEIDGRPVGPGQMACHHCDNPPCVRPTHLFRGTLSDNMQDMNAKGRRNSSPDYRRRMSETKKAAWASASPEKRRVWRARISATQVAAVVRCGAPLAQTDGLCFRRLNHAGSHRSEQSVVNRR